ncbi:MAG: peptide chain release factor 2 [Actinomycetota bacterium]
MEPTDLRSLLNELRSRLDDARRFLDIEAKENELVDLKEQASAPGLWDDQDRALEVTRKLARNERTIGLVASLESALDDAEVLIELAVEEDDASGFDDALTELRETESTLGTLERETLFFGPYDDSTAIVSVHAGAGGVDAQDWADMLFRMYLRYLERADLSFEVDEYQVGEEAGIKSATITVTGDHAYGIFESERGVHRLVRISPFDSNARRHTAFAGVDVIPEVDVKEVDINAEDVRIDTYRASGAGGQHVNKTDSAVRLTHIPTGVVVSCQAERSQLQNRAKAMQLLAARLAERARLEQQKEVDAIRGDQTEAGWGRQIRSYVLQPYQMVKDLRTGHEIGNIQGVLDGDLDALIDSYLQWRREVAE